MRREGARQNGDIPGVTPFLVDHETHSSTFGFTASAVLSIRKSEKLSDGVTAVSGTEVMSMFQSNKGCYSLLCPVGNVSWLEDHTSYFPRIGHWWAGYSVEEDGEPFFSVCCGSQHVSRGDSWSVASGGYSRGHCSSPCSGESQVAMLDSWIKCPETG